MSENYKGNDGRPGHRGYSGPFVVEKSRYLTYVVKVFLEAIKELEYSNLPGY